MTWGCGQPALLLRGPLVPFVLGTAGVPARGIEEELCLPDFIEKLTDQRRHCQGGRKGMKLNSDTGRTRCRISLGSHPDDCAQKFSAGRAGRRL